MAATDIVKLVVAAAMVVAGIAGYYLLAAHSIALRFLAVLAGIVAGVAAAWTSAPGQEFLAFAREALIEVRKVVWPTRKETLHTTGVVFAFVVVMAVFLYVSDRTLEWVLFELILGWKKT